MRSTLSFGLVLALGCAPEPLRGPSGLVGTDGDADTDADTDADADGDADSWVGDMPEAVFAHDDSTLYRLSPSTLEIAEVGPFGFPAGHEGDAMTDIAVDGNGNVIGVSFSEVYRIDPETAACVWLASLETSFNGLSFVVDDSGNERLTGTDQDGRVHAVDPTNGSATYIGQYGGGLGSSGDLVSVEGLGTLATATDFVSPGDFLVRINSDTGEATPVAQMEVGDVWGLAFWAGRLYGFAAGGEVLRIDLENNVVETVGNGPSWWGAAVSTQAPLFE